MKIGIDLVEHKDIVDRDIRFIKRVLSNDEFEIYNKMSNEKRKVEYVASRFACKEAIFKCFEETEQPFRFSDISIKNKKNGAPYVTILEQVWSLQISLSHTDNYSVAVAILPSNDDD